MLALLLIGSAPIICLFRLCHGPVLGLLIGVSESGIISMLGSSSGVDLVSSCTRFTLFSILQVLLGMFQSGEIRTACSGGCNTRSLGKQEVKIFHSGLKMSPNSTKYIYIIIKRAKHLGRSNKIKFCKKVYTRQPKYDYTDAILAPATWIKALLLL